MAKHPSKPTDPGDLWPARRRAAFRRTLLAWYRRHHRRLPWRAEPGQRADPYHVLVSELMLQQTRVATVVDYFERFIRRWPTARDLADADEQDVLHAWQGLGYYRRARHLHAAAKRVVDHHAGQTPTDLDALLALPGVGRYTAGAIASIAGGRATPVLDGNVARGLVRLWAIDSPVDRPAVQRRLWVLAASLLPQPRRGAAHHPGDVNQALMELGATVCTPRTPACLRCPVRRFCDAFEQGRAEQLPVAGRRTEQTPVTHHVLAIRRGERLLVRRRPDDGLWAGMWELPTCERLPAGDDCPSSAVARWVEDELGLRIAKPQPAGRFTHLTTHRRITFRLWSAGEASGRRRRGSGRWLKPGDLLALPMSNPQRRAVAELVPES